MDKNCIQAEQGQALADEYGIKFIETSAKEGTNIAEAFQNLLKDVVRKIDELTDILI